MDYEFNELIAQVQVGNKEALEKLFVDNKKLIYYVVKKMCVVYHDMEDLFQTGSIGLIKAINTFDINKNFKFSSYAVRCIQNEIGGYLRTENKTISNISIDDEGKEIILREALKGKNNNFDVEAVLDFENAFKKMKPKYKTIINLLFNKGMTQIEAAKLLNVSRQEISRVKIAALKKLRVHMNA